MAYPARASKLDPYAEEIFALHREGRPLAYIGKHLAATHGLSTALSTLSEFIKRGPRAVATPAPPPTPAAPRERRPTVGEEMLLDQVEVYAEIQGAIRLLAEDVQGMQAALPALGTDLRAELAKLTGRLGEISGQMNRLTHASPTALPAETAALLGRLEALLKTGERHGTSARLVPPAVLRRTWALALGVASAFWLALFALFVYAVGFR